MSESVIGLLVDGTLAILLAVAVYYIWRLNRNLGVFRKAQSEMDQLFKELGEEISRAERAIDRMKQGAEDRNDSLQRQIKIAQGLSDQLQIMVEAAEAQADRLEKGGVAPTTAKVMSRTEKNLESALAKKKGTT